MGENSKIQWTDHTFNGWIGCTKVSPACDHCYAESLAERYGWAEWGVGKPRHRTSAENWKKPLAWDRKAAKLGVRHRVFANSLSDWADAEVPNEWRADLIDLVEKTPNLDWLLLTKRPKVARDYFRKRGSVPANAWVGTTVENQAMADTRIPKLLQIPARVHFLSMEPLLGPVDLHEVIPDPLAWNFAHGFNGIDWVIVGGESGQGWRPLDTESVLFLRDQCQAAGVPFFFKQWAGLNPKALGRQIGGREWNQVPA